MTEILICSKELNFINQTLKQLFPENFVNSGEISFKNIDLIVVNDTGSFHISSSEKIPFSKSGYEKIIIDPSLNEEYQ